MSASQGLSGAVTLETRCVAGPVSQLSTDPFATVPTGVQEEISRFVAQDTSGFQQRSHAPQPPTQDNVSSTAFWAARRSFTSTKRRTCFDMCQQWAATPETPGLSPVQRPSNRLPMRTHCGRRDTRCVRECCQPHTDSLLIGCNLQTDNGEASRMHAAAQLTLVGLLCNLPCQSLRLRREGHCRCNTQDELL